MGDQLTTAITLNGLTKRFGRKTAVQDVSFEVQPGDVFGLLGPNGAGKTTIIRMIVALMKPTHGQIRVFGFDPQSHAREVLTRSATILESPAMYPKLSAYDNLRTMALMSGITDRGRIMDVLRVVGLTDRAQDKFESFSLGMKQRLCVAASLLNNPDLIILDEPTNGLDPAGMADIRSLIRDLASGGHTVLLSSHLLHEVQQVCNRVTILQRGAVVVSGVVDQLLAARVMYRIDVAKSEADRAQQAILARGFAVSQVNQFTDNMTDADGMHDSASAPATNGNIWLEVRGGGLGNIASLIAGRDLNRLLVEQGIYADSILLERGSLEDFYLALTRPDAKLT